MSNAITLPTQVITSGFGSPWSNPAGWDTIWLGGVYYGWGAPGSSTISGTPTLAALQANANVIGGRVRVRGAKRSYRLDTKQPKGQDGWTTTYRGKMAREFEIIFWMWTPNQYDYFTQNMLPGLFYGAGANIDNPNVSATGPAGIQANSLNPNGVQALGVYYPSLAPLGITSVEVADIGAIEPNTHEPNDTPQWYTCTIKVAEYLPPPPANVTATPVGNKSVDQPSTPGIQPSTAEQKRQAAIFNAQARGFLLDTGHPVPLSE